MHFLLILNLSLYSIVAGIRTEELVSQSSHPQRESSLEVSQTTWITNFEFPVIFAICTLNLCIEHVESQDGNEAWKMRNSRRLMIGSTAPTCTYNECRGCKYKCRAEQVPVEGNDPINSPYHYRCVCHRWYMIVHNEFYSIM